MQSVNEAIAARNQILSDLEDMIDAYGMTSVLDMLAAIAYGKSDHLASNWQDKNGAKAWMLAAKRIDTLSGHIVIQAVS